MILLPSEGSAAWHPIGVAWSALVARGGTVFNSLEGTTNELAPNFRLSLDDGGTFQLADQRGKVVVVNFWASWCVPCRAEAPRFVAASRAYRDRGVVFVGIDVSDTPDNARAFLREFGVTYANGIDENMNITEAYRVNGLPATFIVDRQGKLQQRREGEIQAEQLSGFIEEAIQ